MNPETGRKNLSEQGFYETKTKIEFVTFAAMPSMIYQACLKTGVISNTVYIQRAVCEALARDLEIPVEEVYAQLPAPRGPALHLYPVHERQRGRFAVPGEQPFVHSRVGPANTIEEVR